VKTVARTRQRHKNSAEKNRDVKFGNGCPNPSVELSVVESSDPAMNILQRIPPQALAALAAEIPDIVPDEIARKVSPCSPRERALHIEDAPPLVDEQIKTIAAYIREREDSFESLPELPREALRSFVTIRKYVATEELVRIEERILAGLRKRFGPFDENALVTFLVKYLL